MWNHYKFPPTTVTVKIYRAEAKLPLMINVVMRYLLVLAGSTIKEEIHSTLLDNRKD